MLLYTLLLWPDLGRRNLRSADFSNGFAESRKRELREAGLEGLFRCVENKERPASIEGERGEELREGERAGKRRQGRGLGFFHTR